MKAHDVRHLAICPKCGDLVDRRRSVPLYGSHYHGKCAYRLLGADALVALPPDVTSHVRLSDIPKIVMQRLLDRV